MSENPYADTTSYPPPPPPPAQYGAPYPYAGLPVASDRQWPLAGWGSRVGAFLIDALVACIGLIPVFVGLGLMAAGAPSATQVDQVTGELTATGANGGLVGFGVLLMVLGYVLCLGIQIWNRCVKQGRTGQSVGKKALGLYLVGERTGDPIGAGMAFLREIAHVLDGFFYLGYLWPLWDAKRQAFADKLVGTLVARAPRT